MPCNEGKMLRDAIRPLPVHLATALSYDQGFSLGQDYQTYIDGIQKYQSHPFQRDQNNVTPVWQLGQASITYFPATGAEERRLKPIFLVPSLINKSYIFDLLEQRSFVRWLNGQGVDVYLLDWGGLTDDPDMSDLTSLTIKRFIPAMQYVADQCEGFHVAGYCMGGTLLAGAAMHYSDKISSLIFLAAPWDFHCGDDLLRKQVHLGAAQALQFIANKNLLPVHWVQSVFAAVNADRAMQKFIHFSALDQDSEQARLFVATEDWLNDGLDLPGPVAEECISDWYGKNLCGLKKWELASVVVDPSLITLPSLVITSENDRIVPARSAVALSDQLRHSVHYSAACGHIGMMTGSKAETQVWRPILEWLQNN